MPSLNQMTSSNPKMDSTFTSVQFSHSVVSNSLQPHGLQPPCPSPTPGACSNSNPLSQWCYPTISSLVIPFSSCLQSVPGSGSFPRSQFFASGGQSIGVLASASVLPMNIQGWFPLRWIGLISLQSKGLFSCRCPLFLPAFAHGVFISCAFCDFLKKLTTCSCSLGNSLGVSLRYGLKVIFSVLGYLSELPIQNYVKF